MIKLALISIIAVIGIVGCGEGGGGSEEPTASAPVAPAGFQYKTTQDLSLQIEIEYDNTSDFSTSEQRQIIIYDTTSQNDEILPYGEVLKNSVIKPDETFTTSLNLGYHIDEIKISIPSLLYECVFTVPDLSLVDSCDIDNSVDYNRTITVTESFN